MAQFQTITARPDPTKVLPLKRPARTKFDELCPRLNVSEMFIPEAKRISGTGTNWRFRGMYNNLEAVLAGNQAPTLLTMGNKGLMSLAFGESGAGINNGSFKLPGVELLSGKDGNSFFIAFFFYARPADSANGVTAGSGTIFAEAATDGAGMTLSIDAEGSIIYDPQRGVGSFALRTLVANQGDPHGTIEVYGLEHNTIDKYARLWKGTATTPWIENTNVTEPILGGPLKWGSRDATLNGAAATGIRITPGISIPGRIAAADRIELMTALAALI